MTRVKRGSVAIKRHHRILQATKGFRGAHHKLFRTANQQYFKSFRYSYSDSRKRKSQFRNLWIKRINAASRYNKLNYSQFIYGLQVSHIRLNRKVLAQLSIFDELSFQKIVKTVITANI